jgi:hypothetical protein
LQQVRREAGDASVIRAGHELVRGVGGSVRGGVRRGGGLVAAAEGDGQLPAEQKDKNSHDKAKLFRAFKKAAYWTHFNPGCS